MSAAPSSAIDEPHAPRPVGSRQRCRSASSDSGRRSQNSATCAEYKGRDRALYPEDGTPGSTKPKAGLAITLIHGAGVHCPSPRIVTYSRPFAPMARPCDPEPPDHVWAGAIHRGLDTGGVVGWVRAVGRRCASSGGWGHAAVKAIRPSCSRRCRRRWGVATPQLGCGITRSASVTRPVTRIQACWRHRGCAVV
jgi:hypothetical protein